MLTVALTVIAAALAFAAGFVSFGLGSAIFLAFLAAIPTFILLGRRVRKRVEAARPEIEAHIGAQRFQRAVERLESLRPLARWQPLLGSSIDEQIGILRYSAMRDFDGAEPFLERARVKGGHAWAMLGANRFRKKRYDDMVKLFELGTKRKKKDALLWATYAWCEWKRGKDDAALQVMARARTVLPGDERLKRVQNALQNDKRMKMKPFGQEWYALHLEAMPTAPMARQVARNHPAMRGLRR